VLGLLPTGAGKSICYQVPGLYFGGLTLVVSPLIALIKDQVEQLRKVGINAQSIHAGMDKSEIDAILDNCVFDKTIRFLFVSPERLLSELFQARVERMDVKLLVVDEAHCISQWGYDFRPSYLNIIDIVEKLKQTSIPVLALTASATPEVQNDIVEKLHLGKTAFVFKGEFTRDNLSLNVRLVDDKYIKLLEILRAVQGTSIVYVSSRRMAEQIARFLDSNGVSSLFYHAGLKSDERAKRQYLWINNRVRVIVATNAFGMGIDKSSVRTVIHFQLPSSLEAYYQEAGRAGRDGKKAYTVLLYNEDDKQQLIKRFDDSYPGFDTVLRVYNSLGNFYKLALGVRPIGSFDFDLNQISGAYKIPKSTFYYAIKRLESVGVIALNDAYKSPSRVKILFNHQELYRYQVANERNESLLKALLRTYGANIFIEYLKINEQLLANEVGKGKQNVVDQLHHLAKQKVIDFQVTNENPQITFTEGRCSKDKLKSFYKIVEELKVNRNEALSQFVNYLTTSECRSLLIAKYFGFPATACGVCDVCVSNQPNHTIREIILTFLKINGHSSLAVLIEKTHDYPVEMMKKELRLMVDLGLVKMNNEGEIFLVQ
jgi:ATP-dependent DNA helicase RecQ